LKENKANGGGNRFTIRERNVEKVNMAQGIRCYVSELRNAKLFRIRLVLFEKLFLVSALSDFYVHTSSPRSKKPLRLRLHRWLPQSLRLIVIPS